MADKDYVHGTMDVSSQKSTYQHVMGFSSKWGVPLSLGLTAFFTSLLLGAGLASILVFVGVTIFCHVIVKMFFSH